MRSLALLHKQGIVFGDVNPGNFLVDERDGDRVYLIDWETVSTTKQDMEYLHAMFLVLKQRKLFASNNRFPS